MYIMPSQNRVNYKLLESIRKGGGQKTDGHRRFIKQCVPIQPYSETQSEYQEF